MVSRVVVILHSNLRVHTVIVVTMRNALPCYLPVHQRGHPQRSAGSVGEGPAPDTDPTH